jgi:hypothetical protein
MAAFPRNHWDVGVGQTGHVGMDIYIAKVSMRKILSKSAIWPAQQRKGFSTFCRQNVCRDCPPWSQNGAHSSFTKQ